MAIVQPRELGDRGASAHDSIPDKGKRSNKHVGAVDSLPPGVASVGYMERARLTAFWRG
jgi:hypothetical protein